MSQNSLFLSLNTIFVSFEHLSFHGYITQLVIF